MDHNYRKLSFEVAWQNTSQGKVMQHFVGSFVENRLFDLSSWKLSQMLCSIFELISHKELMLQARAMRGFFQSSVFALEKVFLWHPRYLLQSIVDIIFTLQSGILAHSSEFFILQSSLQTLEIISIIIVTYFLLEVLLRIFALG